MSFDDGLLSSKRGLRDEPDWERYLDAETRRLLYETRRREAQRRALNEINRARRVIRG